MAASEDVQETAAEDLCSGLDAGDGTLVTLVAGDTRLVAHRAVLSARSPVFAAMFGHDTLEASSGEVAIRDVEGVVLRQLLSYLYFLQAPQLPNMAAQLLVAADKYGVEGLKARCEHRLACQLTVESAAGTAVLAVRYSCPSLTEVAVAFIKANPQVLGMHGWAQAVLDQPEDAAQVSRLLAEAGSSSTGRSRHIFIPPPDPAVLSRIRKVPEEERDMRLFVVAQMGAVEELKALLVAGANIGAKDDDYFQMTALHWAAARGHAEAVRCLIEAGAEVDAKECMQCTPLHSSAYRGRTAAVQVLLAASADPNARNHWRRTPLHDAAEQGYPDIVDALLKAGADRAARADNRLTPLDLARRNDRQQVIEILS